MFSGKFASVWSMRYARWRKSELEAKVASVRNFQQDTGSSPFPDGCPGRRAISRAMGSTKCVIEGTGSGTRPPVREGWVNSWIVLPGVQVRPDWVEKIHSSRIRHPTALWPIRSAGRRLTALKVQYASERTTPISARISRRLIEAVKLHLRAVDTGTT